MPQSARLSSIRVKQLTLDLKKCKQSYRVLLRQSHVAQKAAQRVCELLFLQQEEDKKEISRELHDEIAQILTGVTFELAILSKQAAKSTEGLRERIASTQHLVETSVETIHRYARELRPMILDDLGLVDALRSYAKEFTKRSEIPVSLLSQVRTLNLSDFNKTVLFRVAQEALNNIAKHSHASRVRIWIRKKGQSVQLEIHDNGRVFEVPDFNSITNSKRMGLLGMNERVKMARGTLTVQSTKNKWTRIIALVPMKSVPGLRR